MLETAAPSQAPWQHRSHGKGGSSTQPAPVPAVSSLPQVFHPLITLPSPSSPPTCLGAHPCPTPSQKLHFSSKAFPALAPGRVLHLKTPKRGL